MTAAGERAEADAKLQRERATWRDELKAARAAAAEAATLTERAAAERAAAAEQAAAAKVAAAERASAAQVSDAKKWVAAAMAEVRRRASARRARRRGCVVAGGCGGDTAARTGGAARRVEAAATAAATAEAAAVEAATRRAVEATAEETLMAMPWARGGLRGWRISPPSARAELPASTPPVRDDDDDDAAAAAAAAAASRPPSAVLHDACAMLLVSRAELVPALHHVVRVAVIVPQLERLVGVIRVAWAFAYGQYHGGAEPPTAMPSIETFEPVMRRWAVDLASHERDAKRMKLALERAAAFKRDVAMHLSMDADAHARALLRAIAAAVAGRHITEV